jgi:hypothetical protein
MGTERKVALHSRARLISSAMALLCSMALKPEASSSKPEDEPLPVFGIVDARYPNVAPSLQLPAGVTVSKPMRFVRLSEPAGSVIECCVRATRKRARTSVIVVAGASQTAAQALRAKLTRRAQQGFIGLAILADSARSVENTADLQSTRVSPNEIQIAWPDAKRTVVAYHCLSREGLHVRVLDTASNSEVVRYYVPLGVDTEPDCSDELMPMR